MFKFNFDLHDIDDNSQVIAGAMQAHREEQSLLTTPPLATAPDAFIEHPIGDLVSWIANDTSLLSDLNPNKY